MTILFKRILFFTKTILTSLIICIILVINFLDYKEVRSNAEYLTLLSKVDGLKGDDIDPGKLEHKIAAWVLDHHPGTGKAYLDARIKLAGLLKANGLSEEAIRRGKGYRDEGKNKFQALSIQKEPFPETDGSNDHSVEQATTLFRYLAAPTRINMLTDVDTASFAAEQRKLAAQSAFSQPTSPQGSTSPVNPAASTSLPDIAEENDDTEPILRGAARPFERYDFDGLIFKKDSVTLYFIERVGQAQEDPRKQEMHLKAAHQMIEVPSLLYFAGYDSALIDRAYKDSSQLEQINDLYGNQSTYKAGALLDRALENNTGPVSVLGFSVSRKWFPLVMLMVVCLLNFIIYRNCNAARKERLPIIIHSESDDALEMLITNKIIRLVLWVVAPLLIMLFILQTSFIRYSYAYYATVVFFSVVSAVFGWLAYRLSGKL